MRPLKSSTLLFAGLGLMAVTHPAYAQDNDDEIVATATRTEKTVLEAPAAITVQDMDELVQKGLTYGTDEFRGVSGVTIGFGASPLLRLKL